MVRVTLNLMLLLHFRVLGLQAGATTPSCSGRAGTQTQNFTHAKQVFYLNKPHASPLATF